MEEEWRGIPKTQNTHEVSNQGHIRNAGTKRVLKPQRSNGVYHKVGIRGMCLTYHAAVVEAFIGPAPEAGMTIDHINRNTKDNRLVNLRWATRQQQSANRVRKASEGYRPVLRITPDGTSTRFASMKQAAVEMHTVHGTTLRAAQTSIDRAIARKKTWRGDIWMYPPKDNAGDIRKVPRSIYGTDHDFFACSDGTIELKLGHWSRGNQLPSGYRRICLDGKHLSAHRLLAFTFLGDPPFPNAVVNHKNGDKGDNALCNLEWMTYSQNSQAYQQNAKNVTQ